MFLIFLFCFLASLIFFKELFPFPYLIFFFPLCCYSIPLLSYLLCFSSKESFIKSLSVLPGVGTNMKFLSKLLLTFPLIPFKFSKILLSLSILVQIKIKLSLILFYWKNYKAQENWCYSLLIILWTWQDTAPNINRLPYLQNLIFDSHFIS